MTDRNNKEVVPFLATGTVTSAPVSHLSNGAAAPTASWTWRRIDTNGECFGEGNASVEKGCSAASGAFAALATDEMFLPCWKDSKYITHFLARNQPGMQSTYGPLLLVGGGDDILFTETAGRKIFQRLCNSGAQAQRNVYPGLEHDPVVYGSLRDQLDWIAA
jgi:acetyl esterase/lipase